jgi:hypothetical protein
VRQTPCNATVTKSLSNSSCITLKINQTKTRCLIDSGSFHSIIAKHLAHRLRIKVQPLTEETQQTLFSASGSQLRLIGTADVILNISELHIPHTLYVCENLSESLILGRSFLTDSSAVIDFRNQTITLSDVIQLPLHHKISKDEFVRANDAFCIKAKTEIILPVKCAKKFNNQDVLLAPIPGEQFRRFAVANSIGHVNQNQTVCRLINCSDEPLVICAGQKIAHISVFDDSYRCLLVNEKQHVQPAEKGEYVEPTVDEETLNKFADEYQFNISSKLSTDLRLDLLRVLFKRKEAFARSLSDLKSYNKEEFEIQMSSSKPLWQKQFKHKPEHARILQAHIDEWQRCGIVEPSTNYHFRNPIFLVAKGSLKDVKDAKEALNPKHFRAVLDLRKLNSRCSGLKTFTPPTRELIDEITKYSDNPPYQRSKWYSSFDFLNGFHQISLKPSSRPFFSFSSMRGDHLQFTKIPFGYKDSPHYFSMVMNRVLGPLRDRAFLAYYVDDVVIHTVSPQDHIKHIDEFLSVLIDNGLKCSVGKSFLMQNEIRFLGVEIGPDGVSIPKQVSRTLDKLETMPMNSPRAVQRFLGFINFWRAHVPNVAQRTHHLRQVIRKDAPFKFTEQCQQERLDLISALRTAQTLQPLAENVEIYIFVDTSRQGIGATIAQPDLSSGKPLGVQTELATIRKGYTRLRPVAHMSWTLKPAEQFYSSTSLEMTGLYKTLMAISHWATTRLIHVVSDNIGLVSFGQLKLGNARERRMLAFLQSFDIRLHYLKGSKHTSADYLSRLSSELTPAEKVEWQSSDSDDYLDDLLFSVTSQMSATTDDRTEMTNKRAWQVYLLGSQPDDANLSSPQTTTLISSDSSASPSVHESHLLELLQPDTIANLDSRQDAMTHRSGILPPSGEPSCTVDTPSTLTRTSDERFKDTLNAHASAHLTRCSEIHSLVSNASTDLIPQKCGSGLNVNAEPYYPSDKCTGELSSPTIIRAHVDQRSLLENIADHRHLAAPVVQDTQEVIDNDKIHKLGDIVGAVRHLRRSVTQSTETRQQTNKPATQTQGEEAQPIFNIPRLVEQDYLNDPECAAIWNFLAFNQLTGDRKQDYHTVIVAPLYLIEDGKLYRITFSRSQKRSADGTSRKLVVIPHKFQQAVIVDLHEKYGHPAAQKLYDTARILFYFKGLFTACVEIAKTCHICQQVKIDRHRQIPALKSLPIFGPAQVWAIDFKTLSRKTIQGHTAILVICDTFSNYCMYEPMIDQSALQTAQALIRRLFASEPQTKGLVSDKGSAFMSSVFKIITQKILGWTHWSSSSLQPQSHGMVESAVAQLNKFINLYVPSDSLIADYLPLLELAQRVTVSKSTGYSPFETLRGFQPDLHLTGEVLSRDTPAPSQPAYIAWLKDRLKAIHEDVHRNLIHSRSQQKASFDKRNHVSAPDWQEGDKVWLERTQPRARSDNILTHKRYGDTPWFITKIVTRPATPNQNADMYSDMQNTDVAPAYQLCNAKTGKTLKYLVPSRRLKRCYDRTQLDEQFHPPSESHMSSNDVAVTPQGLTPHQQQNANEGSHGPGNSELPEGWDKAKHIIRKRLRQNQTEFLVRFYDNSAHWCTDTETSDELKRRFFLKQAQIRNRRQRAARNRFRDSWC